MAKVYKRYGATTDGYRGERAILEERVIEGLEEASFSDQRLQLDPTSKRTLYLTNDNMSTGNYIVLPNAKDLWPNWQVSVINDSSTTCPIYYYTDDYSQLSLFKEVTSGNMTTCILINDSTFEGVWSTLRTSEQSSIDLLNKYTSDVYEEMDVTWNQIAQDDSDVDPGTNIRILLGSVLAGTAVKSVYVKTTETFSGSGSLSLSIGTATESDKFIDDYDLTQAASDSNFTKDVFEEILSNTNDTALYATFNGTNLTSLNAGSVKIVVEKAKLIDPTVLKNPIVQTQIPIGVIMNYAFSDLPEGYWRLDGSILPNAANAVPQFVNKLNSINNQLPSTAKLIVGIDEWNNIYNTYGSCGKFAWVGSGLKFPQINCFIRGISDLNQLAQFVDDTMRPITGWVSGSNAKGIQYPGAGGAFTVSTMWQTHNGTSKDGRTTMNGFAFDSSRLGANYNGTVTQPKHVKYPYIICVYNKIQNASVIDLDEIIEASVNKANISLNNLDTTGINTINNLARQSAKVTCTGKPNYNAGFGLSNGTTYNLTYDVWVFANNQVMNSRAYMYINGTQLPMSGYDSNDGHGSSCVIFFPAGTSFSFVNMSALIAWPTI